jgi:hypothetical protein
VFRSDCKVFDCISSKSEQNWCFGVIVRYSAVFLPNPSRIGVLSWFEFELVFCLTLGVYCILLLYILYYYYILYITILLYTIIIYTIIIYYTLPFFLYSPSQPSIPYSSLLYLPIILLPLQYSSIYLPFPPPQYSFYTCRYLHILIYIPDSSPTI